MEDREIIEKELWDRYNSRFSNKPSRKYREYRKVPAGFLIKLTLVTWWIGLAYILFKLL